MSRTEPQASDDEALSLIKGLSGRLIERRRRRERVSQRDLARNVGRSERWLREIEGGIPTAALDDHIRCAHALGMTTTHLFLPLLAIEHDLAVPREVLLLDDPWALERDMLDVVDSHHRAVLGRKGAGR